MTGKEGCTLLSMAHSEVLSLCDAGTVGRLSVLSRFGREQRLRRRQRRAQIGSLLRSKKDMLKNAGFNLAKAAEAEDASAGAGLGPKLGGGGMRPPPLDTAAAQHAAKLMGHHNLGGGSGEGTDLTGLITTRGPKQVTPSLPSLLPPPRRRPTRLRAPHRSHRQGGADPARR